MTTRHILEAVIQTRRVSRRCSVWSLRSVVLYNHWRSTPNASRDFLGIFTPSIGHFLPPKTWKSLASLRLNVRHPVPPNNRHSHKRRHTTEHQRHNPPRGKPRRNLPRTPVLSAQIEQIDSVARGISLGGDVPRFAILQVVAGDVARELALQTQRVFDDCCDEPGGYVPFYVA